MRCAWCADPNSEAEIGLCRSHDAERLGLTEGELGRMQDEQDAEYADTLG